MARYSPLQPRKPLDDITYQVVEDQALARIVDVGQCERSLPRATEKGIQREGGMNMSFPVVGVFFRGLGTT